VSVAKSEALKAEGDPEDFPELNPEGNEDEDA